MLTICIATPLMAVLLLAAAKAYHIYNSNRAANHDLFPVYTPPQIGESLVIVSPHPDDETLGAAGLIQYALAAHVPVHVIFLTDGDAFRVGVARYYHELHVRPGDYVRYGEMREGEARAALGALGLPASDITFLGYPDQGLLPIWRSHWYPADPYRSHFDDQDSVPYPDAYHVGAPFCGIFIVNDLTKLLTQFNATDIYVTHPSDDHPDHAAAPAFVDTAIAQMQADGDSAASQIRVHYFIVHRGDWPVPQGLHPDQKLSPPAPMISLDTRWSLLPMLPRQIVRKQTALTHYGSQQEMMGRFLSSFVRKTELFGDLENREGPLPEVGSSDIKIDGDPSDWPIEAPLDMDPVGDSVIRDFQPAADIIDTYACTDGRVLYIRLDTKAQMEPDIHYGIYIRAFDRKCQTADSSFFVSLTPRNMNPGITYTLSTGARAAYKDSTLEIAVPFDKLGVDRPSAVTIEATTLFAHVLVDKTGIRRAEID